MATSNALKVKSPLHTSSEKQLHRSTHNGNGQYPPSSVRSKAPLSSRRSVTPNSRAAAISINDGEDSEPARVRVSVRVRPKNGEDLSDADSYDCIELQPELKKLKLRKNNWSSESYKFDEVFNGSASQKRVYEVVAKPVVESVLNGYNGTVMAYGQTGTGKTYTVGQLGKEDPSECGIIVRAMKDILATPGPFMAEVSYLQIYLESVQDLLLPEKNNIPIVEDPKTGEVTLPGAAVIKVRDLDHVLQLLQIGETNRHAANTKLNTESSRSHAIFMVHIHKASQGNTEKENSSVAEDTKMDFPVRNRTPIIIKSKLLVVDLAGSERIDKSGSEGHMLEEAKFINLSLTSLGKCINALAENSPHIPTRDSKLTRLLRDSFGGSARTSLIITIGQSARNHAETASTIMFGQRAMKILNMVKLKEEFDYEGLCRKLENQVDYLTAELERQQKLREVDQVEMGRKLRDCQYAFAEAEKSLASRSEQNHLENSTYQKVLAETTQMYEKKITQLIIELEEEHARSVSVQEQLSIVNKIPSDHRNSVQGQKEIDELRMKLQERCVLYEKTVNEVQCLRMENEDLISEKIQEKKEIDELRLKVHELGQMYDKMVKEFQHLKRENEELSSDMIRRENEIDQLRMKLQQMYELHEKAVNESRSLQTERKILLSEKEMLHEELRTLNQRLLVVEKEKKYFEDEHAQLLKLVSTNNGDSENKSRHVNGTNSEALSGFGTPTDLLKLHQPKESVSGQRATIAKIYDEVGLPKIVSMLSSEELEVQIHAVKVVANLAAEDKNQEMIVEEGGLEALLMLLGTSDNGTIHRVASGAIANLAMNELNQVLIMSKGGAQLLANIASKSDDPQTLRMVAGAIANLCGNQKLHVMLKEDGGIEALFRMVQSGNSDVIAQVARGMANFAKCESREAIRGHRKGRSLLLEDGALTWLNANATSTSASTRRHIELALCHLAQNEENAEDFISNGTLKELVRISCQSSKEDIRSLAKRIIRSNPMFRAVMQRP